VNGGVAHQAQAGYGWIQGLPEVLELERDEYSDADSESDTEEARKRGFRNGALARKREYAQELDGQPGMGARRRMVKPGLEPWEHVEAAAALTHPMDRPSLVGTLETQNGGTGWGRSEKNGSNNHQKNTCIICSFFPEKCFPFQKH
jgi:hypothetical protein